MSPPAVDCSVILVLASEDDGGLVRVASTLASGLPRHGIRIAVALEREGRVGAALSSQGIPVSVVPGLLETLDRRPDGRTSAAAVGRNLAGLSGAVRALRDVARRHDAVLFYSLGSWPNHLCAAATRGSAGRTGAVWHVQTAFSRLNHLAARAAAWLGDLRAVIGASESVVTSYRGLARSVEVVHNGVSLDACRDAAGAPVVRARLGLPPDAFVIGYAGRLVAHKGIEILADAAPAMLAAIPNAHLVVLGGNPASAQADVVGALRARFAAAGVGPRVHLPGYMSDALAWVAGFDVALVPSTYADPCPLSVLEALALGVPVVGSRIGGIPELIDSGTTGLLVPPGDRAALAAAVVALAQDPARRARMAEAARIDAERRFDERVMVEAVAGVLRRAAGFDRQAAP